MSVECRMGEEGTAIGTFRQLSVYLSCVAAVVLLSSTAFAGDAIDAPEVEPVWDVQKYNELNRLWDQTDVYWHQGDFESCIRTLKRIIDVDPTQSEAYEDAAWLLDSTDYTFESFDLLVQNTLANPRSSQPYFEVGLRYFFMGGYSDAVKEFERSVFYSDEPVTRRMLAHAYERAGNREKAIETYAELLGHDPQDGAALLNLIRVLNRIPPVGDPTNLWHRPSPRTRAGDD